MKSCYNRQSPEKGKIFLGKPTSFAACLRSLQQATHKQFLVINTKVRFTLDVGQLLCLGYLIFVLRRMDYINFTEFEIKV